AASCKLQAASCKLQAASCKLQAASCNRVNAASGWSSVFCKLSDRSTLQSKPTQVKTARVSLAA
ncbi:hypothetical protein, partial [Halopseudomonas aestusnigri]|uniref:hypothetical protein n=1 Tax=Halopseudomonas aestusnigri TaxID=857252 RepID=UPI0030C76305